MKFKTASLLIALACPSFAHALPLGENFTLIGDLTIVSDYRSRGISQTLGDPAAQLGATFLNNQTGLYAGAWTSNVDFGYGLKTRQEVDYYAGWYFQTTEDVSMDIGYIKYAYPKEGQFNQTESYAYLKAYGFKLSALYSDDAPMLGSKQSTLYTWVGYEHPLPWDMLIDTRYGRVDFKDDIYYSADGSASSGYNEWEVKLSKEYEGVKFSASYIDTDLSKNECMSYYGFDDLCTATVTVSLSKAF